MDKFMEKDEMTRLREEISAYGQMVDYRTLQTRLLVEILDRLISIDEKLEKRD